MSAEPRNIDHVAAYVIRRNGAWLINVPDPRGDATSDQEWDCAAALPDARRTARTMAREFDWPRGGRWHVSANGRMQRLYFPTAHEYYR